MSWSCSSNAALGQETVRRQWLLHLVLHKDANSCKVVQVRAQKTRLESIVKH